LFKASHDAPKTYWLLTSTFIRFLSVAGLTAAITTFLTADKIMLVLFGPEFAEGAPVLRILSGVMAAKFMMVGMQQLLSSLDLHTQRVKGIAIAVVVNLAVNAILIPLYGAEGAAFATLISGILLVWIYVALSGGAPQLRFRHWLLAPSCIVATLCAFAWFVDWGVAVETVLVVTIFLATLFAIRLVTVEDITGILRLLFPDRNSKSPADRSG
jgi:O-antigen/teichoic acid export membrane protein